jgi:pimeloyl-ACP methyl ester carboxylesterase
MTTRTYHRSAKVKGREIFYREAGGGTAPTILLLHGLPTSSQMFRSLIPGLADGFHLIAHGANRHHLDQNHQHDRRAHTGGVRSHRADRRIGPCCRRRATVCGITTAPGGER